MSKKICVTSLTSVGCTFVDWSIQFLSGQSMYYRINESQWINLTRDPLTELNAHGHHKNHPKGFEKTKLYLDKCDHLSDNSVNSMYPTFLSGTAAAKLLNIPKDQIIDNIEKINTARYNDYIKIFDLGEKSNTKIIFIDTDTRVLLYNIGIRNVHTPWESGDSSAIETVEDVRTAYQEIYFQKDINTWQDLNLISRWDDRERQALNCRPFNTVGVEPHLTGQHLWISSLDLWTRTEQIIKKIMKFVELEIDLTRLTEWLPICKKWQDKQQQLLEFAYNYQHIVKSIVNNWYYEINLTFEQEVVIQHCLIYQHGLNLKTWQLEKFPDNTQELHKLLEPNCHVLNDY